MDTQELTQLSLRLATLSGLLEEQAHNAARKIAASSEALLRGVEAQAHTTMAHAAGRAVEPCAGQLQRSAESAKWAADALREQNRVLSGSQQSLVYVGLASLGIGCLLTLATTVYWVRTAREEVARHRVEAALLRAVNEADITICDGRLCANVEMKGKRFGDKKQYRIAAPRNAKPARDKPSQSVSSE